MIKNKEDIENIIPYNTYKYIVETIRPYTEKYLSRRQHGICIGKLNFKYFETSYYIYKGQKNNIYDGKCIVIENFPISNSSKNFKNTLYEIFNSKDLVKPVMIFINNRHIDWNDIEVINGNYTYLYFKNIDNINNIEIYELNFTIDYIKGKCDENLPFISFNTDGKFNIGSSNKDTINYVLKNRKDFEKIVIKKMIINDGFYKNILNDSSQKLFRSSLVFFDNDGLLSDDYNDSIKINNFNSLTVNEKSGKCILIYNYNSNKDYKNNFSDHFENNEYWEDYLIQNGLYDEMYTKLDFYLKSKSLISDNYYIDTLTQILSFNYDLFKDIFNRYFNWIVKYEFKISELQSIKNILNLHKRHNDEFSSNMIVFINGKLISKSGINYIQYLNNIQFDLNNFDKNDKVTIFYFRKTENRIMEFELYNNKDIKIDPAFEIENSKMYTTCIDNQQFGIFNNRKVIYEIPFSFEKISEGSYRIYPQDNKYYNSTVQLHSLNQFRHYSVMAKEHLIKIILPNEFITCNNYYKYQVFINGLRISQFDYKLVYPTSSTPFKEVMIYLKHPVNKYDYIDILYTPTENKEIYIRNIDNNIVEIDKSNLEFPIDPELYTFYINGKLIDNKKIKYISSNKIIIDPEIIESKYNLSIVSSIKNDNFMIEVFKEKNDLLTNIINNIPNEELYKLTNVHKLNAEILKDDDYNKNNLSNKSLIFEIIKDHWISNGIYKGIPTLYDYEKDEISDIRDIENNIVVDILDASEGGKIGC